MQEWCNRCGWAWKRRKRGSESGQGDRDEEGFADYGGQTVQGVEEVGGKRGDGLKVLEDLGVVPGGFAGGTDAPGGDGVFETVGGWESGAEKADVEDLLGGIDEAVEGGVEGGVVGVLGAAVGRGGWV